MKNRHKFPIFLYSGGLSQEFNSNIRFLTSFQEQYKGFPAILRHGGHACWVQGPDFWTPESSWPIIGLDIFPPNRKKKCGSIWTTIFVFNFGWRNYRDPKLNTIALEGLWNGKVLKMLNPFQRTELYFSFVALHKYPLDSHIGSWLYFAPLWFKNLS